MFVAGSFCLLITSGASISAPYFFGQVVDAAQISMGKKHDYIFLLYKILIGSHIVVLGSLAARREQSILIFINTSHSRMYFFRKCRVPPRVMSQ